MEETIKNTTKIVTLTFRHSDQVTQYEWESWIETVVMHEDASIKDLIAVMEKHKRTYCEVTIPEEK